MIPELGHFALALAVAIAGAQAVLPLLGAHTRDCAADGAAPALAIGQLIALAAAYGCLIWSAVVDDFSVLNVAENSNSLKPLIYKITGTWGDHEGSILLWCLILALCGGAVAMFGRNLPSSLRARVIGVLGVTSAGFLLFALTTSNPFVRVWPPPLDGPRHEPAAAGPRPRVPSRRCSTRAMSASRSRSPSPSRRCWKGASMPPGAAGCGPGRWRPGAC